METKVVENSDVQSQVLSGPQGSSTNSHVANPWSGRLRKEASPVGLIDVSRKGKENVDEDMRMPNVIVGHDDVNEHSSGSKHSLDEELGIPSVRTQGVRKLHAKNRALGSNAKPLAQDVEPTCFEEAAKNVKWQEAMNEEMDALYGNETWELVSLPKGKKPIECRWVYKVKHNSDGNISRYNARHVVKEYEQTYGIDYEETFALVAKMTTLRAVIAMAAAKGWILHQMDVKNAFLHGDLQEEEYIWSSHQAFKIQVTQIMYVNFKKLCMG
ncbi:hypothetical protein L7F22_016282 [Adiantum nelumboides]|nr:hypothetical protein [Adiantum nelumboides]